jgi:hypothetical protein
LRFLRVQGSSAAAAKAVTGPAGRLEADRRGDVRQHVIAREQQAARLVVEDHVPAGVTRGVDRAQRARGQFDHRAVGQPVVRVIPLQLGRSSLAGARLVT